jgi:drug/metabolite transporter (DMT)-like permease
MTPTASQASKLGSWDLPVKAFFCALLWGSAIPCIKILFVWTHVSEPRSAIAHAGLRFFLAGVLALIWIPKSKRMSIRKLSFTRWLNLGFFQVVLQYSAFYTALYLVSGTLGAIIVSTGSLWWMLLAPLTDKSETWSPKSLAILCVGILGVAICVWGSNRGSTAPLLGTCILIIATLSNTIVSLQIRPLQKKIDAATLSGASMAIGGFMLMALQPQRTWELVCLMQLRDWGLTFYLVIVSALAFHLWFVLIVQYDVKRMSAYRLLIPICGVVLSIVAFPQETLSLKAFVGGALVLSCIAVMEKLKH